MPEDYYFNERGLMVFTEAYHRRRGYCCGSGCLHCPFNYDAVKNAALKEVLLSRRKT